MIYCDDNDDGGGGVGVGVLLSSIGGGSYWEAEAAGRGVGVSRGLCSWSAPIGCRMRCGSVRVISVRMLITWR